MTWEELLVTLWTIKTCVYVVLRSELRAHCTLGKFFITESSSALNLSLVYLFIMVLGIEHRASYMLSKDFSKPHVKDDNASLKGY